MDFDIAIIGGGPAGYNAAEKAAINGLKTILFEKKELGGVCLNEGCIPTKTLLYSAKILDNIKAATKYGINLQSAPESDLKKMIERKDGVVKKLTMGVDMKLKSVGVTIIRGKALIEKGDNESIEISAGGKNYKTKYILLCCGSETSIPPIEGLSNTKYWTSKEALEMTKLPKSLTIIGGGVIGIEFASFFNSMGVKVTVVEMVSEILGATDKEIAAMLRKEYTKRGVDFLLNTKVLKVSPTHVTVEKSDKKIEEIATDQILLSVGRYAVTQSLGLEALNIKVSKRGVEVNEYMQTNHPNVYACGDITGFSQLAHTAIREGEVALNHILQIDDRMDYNSVPSVVYTNPELASVGKTEEELKAAGIAYQVMKLPMAYSGRFIAENEGGSGVFKILVDQSERIIGCHILGNPASELIVIAGIAIKEGYTLEQFQKHIFPHPTVGEMFHEAIF